MKENEMKKLKKVFQKYFKIYFIKVALQRKKCSSFWKIPGNNVLLKSLDFGSPQNVFCSQPGLLPQVQAPLQFLSCQKRNFFTHPLAQAVTSHFSHPQPACAGDCCSWLPWAQSVLCGAGGAALMVSDLQPWPPVWPPAVRLVACVEHIFLAMRLDLQDSAAKELQREVVILHSGFDLSFCCCPRKWEGVAIFAFPSGPVLISNHLSLWLASSNFSPAMAAKKRWSPVSSKHHSLEGWKGDIRLLSLPPSQFPAFRTELRDESVQELVPCARGD